MSLQALTAWLAEHGVVEMVLKSNLHQAQYAEQAQRVLSMLLKHGALPEGAVAFLWQLTEGGWRREGACGACAGEDKGTACACAGPLVNRQPPLPFLCPPPFTDATTFEAVKSHAYGILASLGPHMQPAQLSQLLRGLQVSAAFPCALHAPLPFSGLRLPPMPRLVPPPPKLCCTPATTLRVRRLARRPAG